MQLNEFIHALESGGDFLLKRLHFYAAESSYIGHSSTTEQEWRMILREPARRLINYLKNHSEPEGIHVDETLQENASAALGVLEAKSHCQGEDKFTMFLGMAKLVRQAFIDLIYEANLREEERKKALAITHRFFDKIELGFCTEWGSRHKMDLIEELQAINRKMTNEKNKYQTIFQSMAEPTFVVDQEMRVIEVNVAFERFFGISSQEIKGKKCAETVCHNLCESCPLEKSMRESSSFSNMEAVIPAQGEKKTVLISGSSLKDTTGIYPGGVAIFQNITQRKQAEEALRESERKYRLLIDNLPNIVFKGYKDWSVDFHDDKIESLTGYKKEEFNSRRMTWFDIVVKEDIERLKDIFIEALRTDKSYVREYRIRTKTGGILWVQEGSQIVCDRNGDIEFITGAFLDITVRKEAEEKVQFLAYYDSITHLPNRQLFKEYMTRALALAKRHNRLLATLFLDLDHFKHINDTLGHRVGDLLLKGVADRLSTVLRTSDVITRPHDEKSTTNVARFGGDEFVICLTDISQAEYAAKIAQRILSKLANVFVLDGHEVFVSSSIGISLYPCDGKDMDTLIRNADVAMYHAKKLGRNNYQFYANTSNIIALDRRRHERLNLNLQTTVSSNRLNPPIEGVTENLSQGGAFVKTGHWSNYQTNNKVLVAFFLPPSFTGYNETISVKGTAEIVRVDQENEGIGLRFAKYFRNFEWF